MWSSRYEDQQANTGRFPFAAGVTLDSLSVTTSADAAVESKNGGGNIKLKFFEKQGGNSIDLLWPLFRPLCGWLLGHFLPH